MFEHFVIDTIIIIIIIIIKSIEKMLPFICLVVQRGRDDVKSENKKLASGREMLRTGKRINK